MKEGLGDILYFLAMIAFFVISSIAKSKKAKKQAVPPSEPTGYPEDTETSGEDSSGFPWLDDIFQDEEEEPPVAETMPETMPGYENMAVEPKPAYTEETANTKKREAFVYSEIDDSDGTGSFWDEEEFDLRKAIVFSEILKRPEL